MSLTNFKNNQNKRFNRNPNDIYLNVGVLGRFFLIIFRKTGWKQQRFIKRDSDGMENIDDFFYDRREEEEEEEEEDDDDFTYQQQQNYKNNQNYERFDKRRTNHQQQEKHHENYEQNNQNYEQRGRTQLKNSFYGNFYNKKIKIKVTA